ncbi:MAG TPA: DnaA N-terminal domain-containing protein, partial [Candidatus Saccharimonadales bacterium]|nr:DnaA N-terminal domain-containing protein [Candidatus Saccharimonadales bacterium]
MQQEGLWEAVLGEIELSVSRGNFVTWFKNTQIVRFKDETLVVGVPNIFVKNQLERKFNDLVISVLAKNGVKPKLVEYKIHAKASPSIHRGEQDVLKNPGGSPGTTTATQVAPRRSAIANVTHAYRQGLNERYSFENFVVGSSNELAYKI